MRQVLGFLLFLASIVVGIYVGFWVCLVGGLVDIFNAIKFDNVSVMTGVWGVIKIFFAGIAGYLSAVVLMIPSLLMMGYTDVKVKIKRK